MMPRDDSMQNRATYSAWVNDPTRKGANDKKNAELAQEIERITQKMPCREPRWTEERRLQIDSLALHHGKRMILWDDAETGFFIWMNWDW
eukprot:CAMPEP_0118923726 /NCGR_PEP_ID=MMETSP1169-20130426/2146_1 /TAXON_ID=36882 /ORGANISM="Pyramimonas obovata, Strain CCMP722" /LENGTH=89 /DNA_ID=CAMNT_0006864755 /DNA_START=108 /DNA_END=374 /DNA_ORIENTATION=+